MEKQTQNKLVNLLTNAPELTKELIYTISEYKPCDTTSLQDFVSGILNSHSVELDDYHFDEKGRTYVLRTFKAEDLMKELNRRLKESQRQLEATNAVLKDSQKNVEQTTSILDIKADALGKIWDLVNEGDWVPNLESLEIVVDDPDEIDYQKDNIYSEMNKGSMLKVKIEDIINEVNDELINMLTQGGN